MSVDTNLVKKVASVQSACVAWGRHVRNALTAKIAFEVVVSDSNQDAKYLVKMPFRGDVSTTGMDLFERILFRFQAALFGYRKALEYLLEQRYVWHDEEAVLELVAERPGEFDFRYELEVSSYDVYQLQRLANAGKLVTLTPLSA
jgi:hypothetical protein